MPKNEQVVHLLLGMAASNRDMYLLARVSSDEEETGLLEALEKIGIFKNGLFDKNVSGEKKGGKKKLDFKHRFAHSNMPWVFFFFFLHACNSGKKRNAYFAKLRKGKSQSQGS